MALDDMSIVNTGVSVSGKENVKAKIKIDFDEASKELDSNDDIKNALEACWSGQDCEQFLNNFYRMIGEVKEKLTDYNREVEEKLDEVYGKWVDFQSTNVQG